MAKKKDAPSERVKSVNQKVRALPKFLHNVVPDSIDLRDRPYIPSIKIIPAEVFAPKVSIPVLNQRQTNACTGFALASVIYHLQLAAKRKPVQYEVSPFMLYSMARRYDEFPGSPGRDTGSSLRGAMKGMEPVPPGFGWASTCRSPSLTTRPRRPIGGLMPCAGRSVRTTEWIAVR